MTTASKTQFDTHYSFALKRIMASRPYLNKRTGKQVRAIDGVFFRGGDIPILNLRDIRPLWTCAEVAWFMAGGSDVAFMRSFGFKNWDAFADSRGIVRSATGHRWRHAHGVDQLAAVIGKLDKDFSNRQAVLVSWLPEEDLNRPGPNVPCLLAWHFHVVDGRLHCSVMQRSADMYFGLPHDILGARMVQELIAAAVQIEPGNISYMVSNAHLYEDQWDVAAELIAREESCDVYANYPYKMGLSADTAKAAVDGDPLVVTALIQQVKKFYTPFPPLSGPRLVP